ncbi:MAG: hypothetical protein HQL16_03445 [Candidatus Omnitrophica bacterium]|nr:hypothetical protein [Candidatus Omnitrophota bacterium]
MTTALGKALAVVLAILIACAPQVSYAQGLFLPEPGTMVERAPAFVPVIFKGLTVHADNPLLFDFIVDTGNTGFKSGPDNAAIRQESDKLIKYFLSSLTLPEKDQWVNLSPYEKDRILPEDLGKTALGRDMLAQDYLLKQVTASLMYPQKDFGREFWARVYARAQKEFGTTDIPVDTFNKVWVVADKANVYVKNNTAFIVGSHLKVMLESDYLAQEKAVGARFIEPGRLAPTEGLMNQTPTNELSKQVIRDVVIPELEKEVNASQNFASLRQIFHSMILATWYKKNLKEALLTQVYANQKKTSGVEGAWVADKKADVDPQAIWEKYAQAYQKGVFNLIKEEPDPVSGDMIPRKYFSGGMTDLARADVVGKEGIDASQAVPVGDSLQVRVAMEKDSAQEQSPSSEEGKVKLGKGVYPLSEVQSVVSVIKRGRARPKANKREKTIVIPLSGQELNTRILQAMADEFWQLKKKDTPQERDDHKQLSKVNLGIGSFLHLSVDPEGLKIALSQEPTGNVLRDLNSGVDFIVNWVDGLAKGRDSAQAFDEAEPTDVFRQNIPLVEDLVPRQNPRAPAAKTVKVWDARGSWRVSLVEKSSPQGYRLVALSDSKKSVTRVILQKLYPGGHKATIIGQMTIEDPESAIFFSSWENVLTLLRTTPLPRAALAYRGNRAAGEARASDIEKFQIPQSNQLTLDYSKSTKLDDKRMLLERRMFFKENGYRLVVSWNPKTLNTTVRLKQWQKEKRWEKLLTQRTLPDPQRALINGSWQEMLLALQKPADAADQAMLGDWESGVLVKKAFAKDIRQGDAVFDWLVRAGYLKEMAPGQGRLTGDMADLETDLRQEYPAATDRILSALRNIQSQPRGAVRGFGWSKLLSVEELRAGKAGAKTISDNLEQKTAVDFLGNSQNFGVHLDHRARIHDTGTGNEVYNIFVYPMTRGDNASFYIGSVTLELRQGHLVKIADLKISSNFSLYLPWVEGFVREKLTALQGASLIRGTDEQEFSSADDAQSSDNAASQENNVFLTAMALDWAGVYPQQLLQMFGWAKTLSAEEQQAQKDVLDRLHFNEVWTERMMRSSNAYDVSLTPNPKMTMAVKNPDAQIAYQIHVTPQDQELKKILDRKAVVMLSFKDGKLADFGKVVFMNDELGQVVSQDAELYAWLPGFIEQKLNDLKGRSFFNKGERTLTILREDAASDSAQNVGPYKSGTGAIRQPSWTKKLSQEEKLALATRVSALMQTGRLVSSIRNAYAADSFDVFLKVRQDTLQATNNGQVLYQIFVKPNQGFSYNYYQGTVALVFKDGRLDSWTPIELHRESPLWPWLQPFIQNELEKSRGSLFVHLEEAALVADSAQVNGGIDMNANNLDMTETGAAPEMAFDPLLIEQFRAGDFTGIRPVILGITPIPSMILSE